MIKAFTAYTDEVDDIEVAVAQIRERLALDEKLLAHSVGIISCYADFVESGVLQAVSNAMPFDVVGATTLGSMAAEAQDEILLTLMVLTSDDVSFATGLTEPIEEENVEVLREAYRKASEALPEKPALMLSYAPLLMNVGGDFFVKALDEITGGVPNFGTTAVDHHQDYHASAVLFNGQAYPNRYAFILFSGNVHPTFYIASISSEKIFQEKGIVTASQGNQLQTVNNVPVGDYLAGLGLQKNADGSITGINSFPFVMDLNDGAMPIVRVMFALTPEGYAVCGGEVPVGATLSVGSIDGAEVVATTERRLSEALAAGAHQCLFIYSCVGRYFAQGYNPLGEIEAIQSTMQDHAIPYHFAYSGCEICPVSRNDDSPATMNRSHNDTCVICAL